MEHDLREAALLADKPQKQKPPGWIADQHRKQEERRCYVCGGRDDGGCHGINGELYECPWY